MFVKSTLAKLEETHAKIQGIERGIKNPQISIVVRSNSVLWTAEFQITEAVMAKLVKIPNFREELKKNSCPGLLVGCIQG